MPILPTPLPSCVRIVLGKGACGTSALAKKTVIVHDVLDVDSASLDAFDETDRTELERVVSVLLPKFGS